MNPFSDNRAQLYQNGYTPWLRIAVLFFGLIFITVLPWWINMIWMTLLIMRCRAWEVLVFAFAMDALYLVPSPHILIPWCTIVALLLLCSFEPLRNYFL
ncbi:MAG: hypothetical protein JWO50_520 [Candidatus Kaiserbacteria bacterium]|nr:hypothetical protein [Candidatus Kaiserbacteria bacterium]